MRLPLVVVLALALMVPAGAEAATKKATKKSCPPGLLPTVKAKKVQRDRKGRLKCAAPKRPAAKVLPRPLAPTPTGQLGVVADQLDAVLAVQPDALKKLERKIGAKRAKMLESDLQAKTKVMKNGEKGALGAVPVLDAK